MHIHRALIKPTDKLSRSTHILPSSRFVEDFILHPTYKILSLLEVVGITLNPEHVQGNFNMNSYNFNIYTYLSRTIRVITIG